MSRFLLAPLIRLFILPISFMAELPFAAVSFENHMAVALVFLWGVLLCIGYRIRPKLRIPVLVLALLITAGGIYSAGAEGKDQLNCTVYGDGMMLLTQGRKAYILLPGEEREAYIESCEERQYDLGRLRVDGLLFCGNVEKSYANRFTAQKIYLPRGETNRHIMGYASGEEIQLDDLTLTVCGSETHAYAFHIQWEDTDILYACGTTEGGSIPEEEMDLVVLDEAMVGSAHGRRELFSHITPTQVVACDAEEGRNFDYLTTWNGPTEWLAADEVLTFTYETR